MTNPTMCQISSNTINPWISDLAITVYIPFSLLLKSRNLDYFCLRQVLMKPGAEILSYMNNKDADQTLL